jgi:glycerophosphoryl diester phosphodiesterase
LDEIKKLDAGSWFNKKYPERAKDEFIGAQIPTLEEIFKEFGTSVNYYIETKRPDLYPGMEDKLIELLKENRLLKDDLTKGKVVIQSFSKESLVKIHNLYPKIPLIQLYYFKSNPDLSNQMLDEIKSYAVGVGINYNALDEKLVDKMKKKGLLVHPYTVDDQEDYQKLKDWGADGVFTNYADIHDLE